MQLMQGWYAFMPDPYEEQEVVWSEVAVSRRFLWVCGGFGVSLNWSGGFSKSPDLL